MRWLWIDRFTEFESGRRARAVKVVSLSEDHLHDHFPGFPVMPPSLIVEGLAQTGGILVGESRAFGPKVILAKVPKIVFHFPAMAGDRLTYEASVEYIQDDGAMVKVTSHVEDRLQAEGEIVFAFINDEKRAPRFFEPKNFVFTMKLLQVFDVGRTAEGQRIQVPPGLAALKAAAEAVEAEQMKRHPLPLPTPRG